MLYQHVQIVHSVILEFMKLVCFIFLQVLKTVCKYI